MPCSISSIQSWFHEPIDVFKEADRLKEVTAIALIAIIVATCSYFYGGNRTSIYCIWAITSAACIATVAVYVVKAFLSRKTEQIASKYLQSMTELYPGLSPEDASARAEQEFEEMTCRIVEAHWDARNAHLTQIQRDKLRKRRVKREQGREVRVILQEGETLAARGRKMQEERQRAYANAVSTLFLGLNLYALPVFSQSFIDENFQNWDSSWDSEVLRPFFQETKRSILRAQQYGMPFLGMRLAILHRDGTKDDVTLVIIVSSKGDCRYFSNSPLIQRSKLTDAMLNWIPRILKGEKIGLPELQIIYKQEGRQGMTMIENRDVTVSLWQD